MANNNWAPQAVAVKQKITVTVGGTLAGETFQLGLGGQVFAEHTDGDTVIVTTVAALVAAWNASTHPWAAAVTATDASPNITLEADVAGVPFGDYLTDDETDDPAGQTWETGVRGYYEIELNTPGGAATLAQDETTTNRGPNCANLADNWSAGTYLADGDAVTIANNGIDILWGLDYGSDDDNWVILDSLDIRKSYAGKIGLDAATFNGLTSAPEYRGTYFQIKVDTDEGDVTIGKHIGPGSVLGSRRIKLDLKGNKCRVVMHGSNSQPFEAGKPAVRILTDNVGGGTLIHVRGAPGGFGIAMDQPGETSEVGRLSIVCASTNDKIFVGPGVKLTDGSEAFHQNGGYCILQHQPSVEGTVVIRGMVFDDGELWTEGDFEVDDCIQNGGVLYPNHWNSTGVSSTKLAFTSVAFNGGVCNTTKTAQDRKWLAVTQGLGKHTLVMHGSSVEIVGFTLVPPGETAGI